MHHTAQGIEREELLKIGYAEDIVGYLNEWSALGKVFVKLNSCAL